MASLPPPSKHPSSRTPPRRPSPAALSRQPQPASGQPWALREDSHVRESKLDAPSGMASPFTPAIEVTPSETPTSPSFPSSTSRERDRDDPPTAPPPRHPSATRFVDPACPSSPETPFRRPPPRGLASAEEAKLAELEDLEIQELLERVGDHLTDVRVAGLDAEAVEYPETEAFRREPGGKVDWIGYTVAYISCLVHNNFPAGLVSPPPPTSFSFRRLQADLERLYVLCPPPVWQRVLLGSFASLWRWENPRRTGTWAVAYLFLWFHDLILLFPFAFFLYHLLTVRFFPPTTEELIRRAMERRNRAKDATELSKQLKASSVVGMAGQGMKGLWADVRERMSRGDDGEEVSVAAGLGAGLVLGGMAASSGLSSSSSDTFERMRPRSRSASTSSPPSASATPPPSSTLARGLGASAAVFSAPSAPTATQLTTLQPPPSQRIDVTDPAYDPARASPEGTEGDENVSLYRLVRNLTTLMGPQVLLWADEVADLLEMVKNLILHPSHPSTLQLIVRLSLVCLVLLFAPSWLVYKLLWLYSGTEIFILWRLRELYPSWRRATLPYWLLLHGAPTDVEYALWRLRGRSRPLKGSKTIKRAKKVETQRGGEGRLRAFSDAVRESGKKALSRSGSETSLLSLGKEEDVVGSFFALHDSTPGTLRLTATAVHFVPSRRLHRLGKLASRISRRPNNSSESDEAGETASIASSTLSADTVAVSEGRITILVDEIATVKKETRMMALEGLLVTAKDGQSWRFSSVARRDDAFNKIISLSSVSWQAT